MCGYLYMYGHEWACMSMYGVDGCIDAYGNILEGFAKNQIARNVTGPREIEI